MRAGLATVVLATSVAARSLPRDTPIDISQLQPLVDNTVFNRHGWPRLTPDQSLAALNQKAKEAPHLISLVPGLKGIMPEIAAMLNHTFHAAEAIKDGFLEMKVEKPKTEQELTAAKGDGALKMAKGSKMAQSAATDATAAGSCTNPAVHYEWRNLSDQHKGQFVAAIKCLITKRARSGLPGTQTVLDDLAAVHQHMSSTIHNVGQFLPWHRYFLWIFEQEIRKCGYTGPMTWWDETKDAGNFNGAPMFTEQYYGHMPDGNNVCIISGQFKNTMLHIGPGQSNTNHCLSRGCDESLSASITTNFVNQCNSWNDFNNMQSCSFFGPHAYGHDAVGAVMSDVDTSPGDPVFFLHHGFINRNWRIWQRTNPGPRTYAIGGSTRQNCGNNCQPTTLDYVLSSLNYYPSVTVRDVMDTQGGFLCYHYDY